MTRRMLPPSVLLASAVLFCSFAASSSHAAGQESVAPITLPDFVERTTESGLRVLAVPDPDAGATTYTLLIPGGSASDPVGREGTAEVAAAAMGLLVGEEDSKWVAGVAASTDAVAITAVDSLNRPTRALRQLGRALVDFEVGDDAVSWGIAQVGTRVRQANESPDGIALRTLLGSVFEGHPYGREPSGVSLGQVDAQTVSGWHSTWVRPDRAVLAVTGPVDADAILDTVERELGQWRMGGRLRDPGDLPALDPLPAGNSRQLLVHAPGSTEATLHLGFALPDGNDSSWTTLSVLDVALGGSTEAELFRVTGPEGEGIVTGAVTGTQRRVGPGLFHIRASVHAGRAADVVQGLLSDLDRVATEFLSAAAVERAREPLAASFPLQFNRSEGLGAMLAVNRLMGIADESLVTYVDRVRRVGPQDVHDVAERFLGSGAATVVVVGDATLLLEDLTAVGEFDVIDRSGQRVDLATLTTEDIAPALDASSLDPVRLDYEVLLGEEVIGTATRTLTAGREDLEDGVVVFSSDAQLGAQLVRQSVTFVAAGLEPVATSARMSDGSQSVEVAGKVDGGVFTGTVSTALGERSVRGPVPPGAIVGDMVEVAAWLLGLGDTGSYRVEVVTPDFDGVTPVVIKVGEPTSLTVPAGTFRATPVVVGGESPQTVWVSLDPPRVPIRLHPAGSPIVIELRSVSMPPGS